MDGRHGQSMPMMIVGRIIRRPDTDIDKLVRWGYAATELLEGLVTQDQLDAAGVAVTELSGYIVEQLRRPRATRRRPAWGPCHRMRLGELDEITAQVMMITLFSAGGESTASLIGSAAWILAVRSDIQQQVRDQLELLGAFLEEVFALRTSISRPLPPRRQRHHAVRDGTQSGSRLLLLWARPTGTRAHFDDPAQFRLNRSAGKNNITFGKGAHLLHWCRARTVGGEDRAGSALGANLTESTRLIPGDGFRVSWCGASGTCTRLRLTGGEATSSGIATSSRLAPPVVGAP